MQAGKGADAQEEKNAGGLPEKDLRAEEDAVPWQPGGVDQIYAVLEVAPPPSPAQLHPSARSLPSRR